MINITTLIIISQNMSEQQKYEDLVEILKQHLETHTVTATTGSEGYAGLSERVQQPTAPTYLSA
jgi:hypothetical protein